MADAEQETEREEQLLQLQRMESKIVAAAVNYPGAISKRAEQQLRYAITLAGVDTFQPGAARKGGRTNRAEVRVRSALLDRFRERLLRELRDEILLPRSGDERLGNAAKALAPLLPELEKARAEILERYAGDFSAAALDQEVGKKTLVTIAGGGGGAAYVYIGAWAALQDAGFVPGYVIGSSMGALLGLFRAMRKRGDFGAYVKFAKSMRSRSEDIFRYVSLSTRYGFPGIVRLYLHAAVGSAFQRDNGDDMLLPDLEIPYEAVVAGIRRGAITESPDEDTRSHHLSVDKRPGPLQLRAQIGAQLVGLAGFISPRVVKEIVIGSDELTREFNVVDAAGFSAAIPGILHYDVAREDPHMDGILTELMKREDVGALVDGGVANNVPARTAWHQVQRGKIGTRNCYYLAMDCFYPQYGLGHIWLQPVTRLISYQVALNARYAQRRLEMYPTLSPINLLPSSAELDKAVGWGHAQINQHIPYIQKFLERVRWVP
ncbi:MAG: patatin-like phospholipase family protein [Candidatus Binatia bacterium]|nr:patatin-like phospholipase family protein [Candidatus Binatia bacterium]